MQVIHLISSTDRRGAQIFAVDLAAHLGGPPQHRVVAMEPGSASRTVPVEVLGSRRSDPRGFAKLTRIVRRADVLVAHGSSALLHGAAASAFARRPFIYRNIGDPTTWGDVRGANLRIGLPLRRASAVAALFPAARDHLVDAYSLRPELVETIPNAVRATPLPDETERRAARESFGLSNELEWIGFLGALSEEKGVLYAIKAIASDPTLGLLVAGSGEQEAEAKRSAERLAPGRVSFIGATDQPEQVMAAVSVLLIPSRTEGIPAVAIEAGLSGLPVVATDVGGTAEVVIDGSTGVLVRTTNAENLAAAIRIALRNRETFGSAARERCLKQFTMDSVAPSWASLISR